MKYLAIIEMGTSSYGAYVPDRPAAWLSVDPAARCEN